MVEIVVIDELAIELPVLLKQRCRWLVEHIFSCSLNVDQHIHITVGLDPEDFPRVNKVVGSSAFLITCMRLTTSPCPAIKKSILPQPKRFLVNPSECSVPSSMRLRT